MVCDHLARFARAALPVPATLFACAALAAPPLDLREAVERAVARSSQIEAQRAAKDAAAASAPVAGELPDPELIVGIENVPVEGPDKFSTTKDSMTMKRIGVMQRFTNGAKRDERRRVANAQLAREEALLWLAETNVKRDTALAWIELSLAEKREALLRALGSEAALQAQAATARVAGGAGGAEEPFMARMAAVQAADLATDAARQTARARAMLARWIGEEARRPLGEAPAFASPPADISDAVVTLEQHANLAMYPATVELAESEARLAAVATRPDWSVEVTYGARGSAYGDMVNVMFRADLPIFESRRQGPAAAAKAAEAARARAEAEDGRRMHLAELESQLADWRSARERTERLERDLVPAANARTAATLASYSGGKASLPAVLESRKAEVEARLSLLDAQATLARAWASLNYSLGTPAKGGMGRKP